MNKKIKSIEKTVNKLGVFSTLIILICGLVGVAVGLFASYSVSKNDCFELIGEKEITIVVGSEYVEQGVNCIEFGKDISSKVVISGTIDTTNEATFEITYTITSTKYKEIKRVRIINVVNEQVEND